MSLEREIVRKLKLEKYKADTYGEGMYVFENNTKGDLYLPRATQSGRRLVRKGQQFLGDNYFFCMLKTNELKLINELQSPEQQQQLLTEQPPTVTGQGPVEYVQQDAPVKVNEQQGDKQDDVLINESPVDGIKILR